jgi:3-dehydroquinate synthetase
VVSLGGGVVGDLTGFAAATYHRGVDWVNIPTSLLAMVDAGIGGRTGVDLPQGKNLVGAFHPPRQVWIDPELLHTLPDKELSSGMAEVIKHGLISDPDLFALTAKGKGNFLKYRDEIIRRAVAVKINIIRKDPFDRDLRQALNFGHTLGHAVELVSGFKLSHGEAIAIT